MSRELLQIITWPFKRRSPTIVLFYSILLMAVCFAIHYMNVPSIACSANRKSLTVSKSAPKNLQQLSKVTQYPIVCTYGIDMNQTCPYSYPTTYEPADQTTRTCPEYFKWIHEDLRPWKDTGITKEMVDAGKKLAFFRLYVVDGKVYWEKYKESYQTRDVFTIWGILQLLRLFPGKLPDLDIMFEAGDLPVIQKSNYTGNESFAPPMFHYCGDDETLDIAFPDWSFWGWPEINIKGWDSLKKDLAEGNNKVEWMDRLPYAFWKGNVYMGDRQKLIECNSTTTWNAFIATQEWDQEIKDGFKSSNLAEQCVHRYKLYIEGMAWSVSEKYILACNSMSLLVTPKWYEFFTRSLMPMKHYWPIQPNNTCESIKFAVNWGNNHIEKAQRIGKAGSKFVQQELTMDHVYDYMFHLLNEYGKLMRYKPIIPPEANEACSEKMLCPEGGLQRKFRIESMVKSPSRRNPCTLAPPQDPQMIKAFINKQHRIIQGVYKWVNMSNFDVDMQTKLNF